jgi:hypothetical protein
MSSRPLSKHAKIKIYETVIMTVVLYGRETWSLALREERRLRVYENRLLRGMFGPKSDEIRVRFEVLTALVMKSSIFWDIAPCSLLGVNRRFGGTCRLHPEGRSISQTSY